MAIARVTEIITSSKKGFDDAIKIGIARAVKTLEGVTGAWVQDQKVEIRNNKVVEYRVNLKITFILTE